MECRPFRLLSRRFESIGTDLLYQQKTIKRNGAAAKTQFCQKLTNQVPFICTNVQNRSNPIVYIIERKVLKSPHIIDFSKYIANKS